MSTKWLTPVLIFVLALLVGTAVMYDPKLLLLFGGGLAAVVGIIWITGKDNWDPAPAEMIRRARRSIITPLVLLCGCVVVPLALGDMEGDSAYIGTIGLVVGILFLFSLLTVGYKLAFRRKHTHWGRWSLVLGSLILSLPALSVLMIGAPAFIAEAGDAGPEGPSPEWFDVKYSAKVSFDAQGRAISEELFDVRPKSHYSVADIAFRDTLGRSSRKQYFMDDTGDGPTRRGVKFSFRQVVPIDVLSIGMLRQKYVFRLPTPRLAVTDVNEHASVSDSLGNWYRIEEAGDIESDVQFSLPPNMVLGSQPSCPINMLPDKDVLNCALHSLPEDVALYVLPRFRFSAVRDLLTHSSEAEVMGKAIMWLFWPIVVLILAKFHKGTANKIFRFLGHQPAEEAI
jgi:hypothetical protein